MSVEVAEQLPTREVYAASLSTIRRLGETSISGVGVDAAVELAYDDFATKTAEMLKTDPELSSILDVTRDKSFLVQDGKVCSVSGRPMVDIVRDGLTASRSSTDERLRLTQAVRDEGDVMVAEAVDELKVGQSMIVVSMDPKTELAGRDAEFWRRRGYRPGIAYIQWYSRVSNDEVCAAAYSADHSDMRVWCELMMARGVSVPDTIDPNTFIRHAWMFEADAEETKDRALLLRRENYERMGAQTDRLSIDDYIENHGALVRAMFDAYYPAAAKALVTGKNVPELQGFAGQLLGQLQSDRLDAATLRQVMRIANLRTFDADMARAMDDLIPYALVEQFRKELLDSSSRKISSNIYAPVMVPNRSIEALQYQSMQQFVLAGIQSGLVAGRSYGGCAGVNVAAGRKNELGIQNSQSIFGGLGEENGKEDDGPDGLGPLRFKCSEGHWNERKPGKLLEKCCVKGCKEGSVGCK